MRDGIEMKKINRENIKRIARLEKELKKTEVAFEELDSNWKEKTAKVEELAEIIEALEAAKKQQEEKEARMVANFEGKRQEVVRDVSFLRKEFHALKKTAAKNERRRTPG